MEIWAASLVWLYIPLFRVRFDAFIHCVLGSNPSGETRRSYKAVFVLADVRYSACCKGSRNLIPGIHGALPYISNIHGHPSRKYCQWVCCLLACVTDAFFGSCFTRRETRETRHKQLSLSASVWRDHISKHFHFICMDLHFCRLESLGTKRIIQLYKHISKSSFFFVKQLRQLLLHGWRYDFRFEKDIITSKGFLTRKMYQQRRYRKPWRCLHGGLIKRRLQIIPLHRVDTCFAFQVSQRKNTFMFECFCILLLRLFTKFKKCKCYMTDMMEPFCYEPESK